MIIRVKTKALIWYITTTSLVEGAEEFLSFLRRSDCILDAIDALDFLVIGTKVDRKFGKHFHTVDLIATVESHLFEVR